MLSQACISRALEILLPTLIVSKFKAFPPHSDEDPRPAFDTEHTLSRVEFIKLKIHQMFLLVLYHDNNFRQQWAQDDWTKNLVDTRMNMIRSSTKRVDNKRSCNVGINGQANVHHFRLILNLFSYVLLLGSSRLPTVAEYDAWHDTNTISVTYKGRQLQMDLDACLQHNTFLLYHAFMQMWTTEKYHYMLGFFHISDIAVGVGIMPEHKYFPAARPFLIRLNNYIYRIGHDGICTEWQWKLSIASDRVWAHIYFILQGLYFNLTVRTQAAANRIVIDGNIGQQFTKEIFKVNLKRAGSSELTPTSESIGILRWKLLPDYQKDTPGFVVETPPHVGPVVNAPAVGNAFGGGVNEFLAYLESLVSNN